MHARVLQKSPPESLPRVPLELLPPLLLELLVRLPPLDRTGDSQTRSVMPAPSISNPYREVRLRQVTPVNLDQQ
jgi:hypothetical protein